MFEKCFQDIYHNRNSGITDHHQHWHWLLIFSSSHSLPLECILIKKMANFCLLCIFFSLLSTRIFFFLIFFYFISMKRRTADQQQQTITTDLYIYRHCVYPVKGEMRLLLNEWKCDFTDKNQRICEPSQGACLEKKSHFQCWKIYYNHHHHHNIETNQERGS